MKTINQQAFDIAKQFISPDSKFYKEDIASLKEFYAKKTPEECTRSICRLQNKLSEYEIAMNDASSQSWGF